MLRSNPPLAIARYRWTKDKIGQFTILVILLRRLVNDGAVFEAAEVKHADTTVCTAAHENVDALRAESDVENFFVVGNQLGFRC